MAIPQEWLQYAPKPGDLKNEKWHVFLSYRSVNRPWVLSLYDVLAELGFKVFLDQYVLKAGDVLIQTLEDGLTKSQAGVLIWSATTQDSEWVKKEYHVLETLATENPNFKFVPVKIEKSKMPAFAASRVFIDFSDYPDGPNGGDLIRLLHSIVGKELSNEAIHFATEQDELSKEDAAKVSAAIKNGNAKKIVQLFETGGLPWKTSAALGCKSAEGLIKLKEYDEAIKILDNLGAQFKKALRPKQLKALALAKRGKEGDLEEAQDILGALYEKNYLDPETMGIYARTWMDRYAKSNNISDLKQSRDLYAEAFEKAPDDYYTGINAASKSIFIGTEKDLQKAAEYAARAQTITGSEAVQGDYWKTATIAEIFLIQKKYSEAAAMYERAVGMARAATDSHESSFKQAKRLMEKLNPSDEEQQMLMEAFKHLQV